MSTTWSDVILQHIDKEQRELYTAMPATITDVSKLNSENSVSVQPALDFRDTDGTSFLMPILEDIPVQWQSGGGAIINFPMAVGDDVLVVFSMRSIVEFQLSSQGTSQPFDNRHHSLSDGFVIGGVFRDSNNPSPSTTDVVLSFNDSEIRIKADNTIELTSSTNAFTLNQDGKVQTVADQTFSVTNSTAELIDLINQLAQQVALITVSSFGAVPNNAAAITAIQTQIATFKE